MAEKPYKEPALALNRIYTRTGDAGETALASGERVPKDAWRIECYGTVDELNAWIGLARATAAGLTAASGAAFLALAWGFYLLRQNPWPGLLAPAFLATLLAYSFSKRVTVLAHWILGLCLGLAPVGVWVALRGDLPAGGWAEWRGSTCRTGCARATGCSRACLKRPLPMA